MFDNPKKELERLEQQLLAAEADDEAEDAFCNEEYDEALDLLLDEPSYEDDDRGFSRRAAGFDIDDTPYEMDSDRYVPAPKKKGIGGLLFIAILELLAAAGLIGWWLGWFQ